MIYKWFGNGSVRKQKAFPMYIESHEECSAKHLEFGSICVWNQINASMDVKREGRGNVTESQFMLVKLFAVDFIIKQLVNLHLISQFQSGTSYKLLISRKVDQLAIAKFAQTKLIRTEHEDIK